MNEEGTGKDILEKKSAKHDEYKSCFELTQYHFLYRMQSAREGTLPDAARALVFRGRRTEDGKFAALCAAGMNPIARLFRRG
jgi:hypothetical protein